MSELDGECEKCGGHCALRLVPYDCAEHLLPAMPAAGSGSLLLHCFSLGASSDPYLDALLATVLQ